MSIEIRKEKISPELARAYLQSNINNRKPIERSISKYSRDMIAGNWTETGDTIKFDINGTLIDGQNRLFAVILSGKSCDFFVARGLSPDAKMATDIGAPRTVNHMLEFKGEKNVAALASTARLCLAYERGILGNMGSSATFSVREITDFVDENPLVRECVNTTRTLGDLRNTFTPSSLAFIAYATLRISPEWSGAFLKMLDMPPQDKMHPCYVAVKTVNALRRQSRRGATVSSLLVLAILIRAWNAFLAGNRVTHFKWGEKDAFPKIMKPKTQFVESNNS